MEYRLDYQLLPTDDVPAPHNQKGWGAAGRAIHRFIESGAPAVQVAVPQHPGRDASHSCRRTAESFRLAIKRGGFAEYIKVRVRGTDVYLINLKEEVINSG